MPQEDVSVHNLLGPRATSPFLVRFGIWFVLAILAAVAVAGSLISYRDRTTLPVQLSDNLPIRSEGGSGRIHVAVTDGARIDKGQIIAWLEPDERGVSTALARIPAPFSATVKRGDLLVCETRDADGVHRGSARVDSVLSTDGDAVVVRVVVAGKPAKGVLTVVGQDHSVLYRLISSLFKK